MLIYTVCWKFRLLRSGSCRRYYSKVQYNEKQFENYEDAENFYEELKENENDKYYPKYDILLKDNEGNIYN